MPGVTPNEGKDVILELIYAGNDFTIGLFTNSSGLSETSVFSDLVEPSSAGGYVTQTLTGASWTVALQNATYPLVQFNASGANFSAPVYGYFIATIEATPKILHFEVDPSAPRTIVDGGPAYNVDLSSIV